MKVNKLLKLRTLMLLLIVGSGMIIGFGSCKNNDSGGGGDKSTLNALITRADSLANAATTTDYPQSDIDNYKSTLQTVKDAAATNLSQVQITNLITQLNTAMTTFKSKGFAYIDETKYLNAGWHFNEGTGTTATAFSPTKHVATFKMGMTAWNTPGTTLPTWVDGVKGGKAIYLDKGAHLEVPFTPEFLPADITISVWVKVDDNHFPDNYIVSQNYKFGYEFQTQGTGRSFFTEAVDPPSKLVDKDCGISDVVKINTWTHLVVALNSSTATETFYVNGSPTIIYTAADGIGPLTRTPMHGPDNALVAGNLPFIIGAAATDADIVANNWTWMANQLSFKGAMDELKIFNIALTNSQVSKLYNDEKP
ncbi:MAG TPA: LamG domain-containing protein [Prolixibacteraceae bacterium]|jgi:hypothetical protein